MGERNLPRVQHGDRHGVPVRRGLAPLDERLSEPERLCAERLRELRERIGLTSEELADRLSGDGISIDSTRLSKFLNGREVPRREIAARLHLLVAEREGVPVDADELARTRSAMYAAARVRSPLQAREFELATAHEDLCRHRARTVQELADLRNELEDERKRRKDAEAALENLGIRSREEARMLTGERDAALDRIAQLENQIRQAGAVLRLRERDVAALDQLMSATDTELVLWEMGGPGGLTGIRAAVVCLRDADEDAAADRLIERIACGYSVRDVMRLVAEFEAMRRVYDSTGVERALARLRKPVDLFHWLSGEGRESKARSDVLTAVASFAPVEHLVRIHKACVEHGSSELDQALRKAMVAERRAVPEDIDDVWAEDLRKGLAALKEWRATSP
ncbi:MULTISPECIES: helix-turn-helix domain-containing protein [Streptomycetaceae]|uniref:helix-turn-helix domain-containing protein n=1 Tax=Streptomycetaceae TaxID=2062 RepID=UPI0013010213|nr:helix-turn-helix domain-containing protein [Streptomyces sp. CB02056]